VLPWEAHPRGNILHLDISWTWLFWKGCSFAIPSTGARTGGMWLLHWSMPGSYCHCATGPVFRCPRARGSGREVGPRSQSQGVLHSGVSDIPGTYGRFHSSHSKSVVVLHRRPKICIQ
jgi:hypothetical protein